MPALFRIILITVLTVAGFFSVASPPDLDFLPTSDFVLGKDSSTIFSTKNFTVLLNPDDQSLPGMIVIKPRHNRLHDWQNWSASESIELLQIVRMCEFALIGTLGPRSPSLRPLEDKKLINLFGNQRIGPNGQPYIFFDLVPRYSKPVVFGHQTYLDGRYGNYFIFERRSMPADDYTKLLRRLRSFISKTNFNIFNRQDKFTQWPGCEICHIHAQQYKSTVATLHGFDVALFLRSQEEPGRGFISSVAHIPALRYWTNDQMVSFMQIFQAYERAVRQVFSTDKPRTFDVMCLMNKAAGTDSSPHTHFHIIPRTYGGKNAGTYFDLSPKTNQPLAEGKVDETLARFRAKFGLEIGQTR